jgi:hypothetical protein
MHTFQFSLRSFTLIPTPPLLRGRGLLAAMVLSLAAGFPSLAQETPPEAPDREAEATGDSFIPKEHTIDRYQKLRGKSPFEFELAKPKEADPTNPFADLVLAGFAGNAGNPTVYLLNSKTQERITVYGEANPRPNQSGFKVIRVDRGKSFASTTATLEKDGVQETLKFDTKALYSMTGGAGGGGAAAGGRPAVPGQPGPPGQGPRPTIPGQARPQQMYQAPQAFIPGQAGRNTPGGQMAGGAFIPGQPQPAAQPAAGGIQLGMQQPGAAQPTNAVPAGAPNAQQQLNALLANPANPGQGQPTIARPVPAVPSANPPPRRRVVLPNTP